MKTEEHWHASPKPKKPRAERLENLSYKIHKAQLEKRDCENQQLKEALREIIPLAQNHSSELLWDEDYSGDKVGGKEAQAIVDAAKKLIELNKPEK